MTDRGRLVFRKEGSFWCCHITNLDGMEGSQHIGSLNISLYHDEEIRERFVDLMKDVIVKLVGAADFTHGQGFEHERVGHA